MEKAEAICAKLADGIPLREICREEGMPAWRTVYDWMDAHPDFAARIARAREQGEEALLSQCLAIADDEREDWELSKKGLVVNETAIGRSKLRIWTRMELLKKWNPRKWGDKVDLNHGVQPENPLATLIQRIAGTGLPVIHEKPGDER